MKTARTTFAILISALSHLAVGAPLPIASIQREGIDFERDVKPFLSDNCLSCHCKTTAKGGLNMETPELMIKGGDSGAAIVPKKSGESLILQAAAHLDEDLAMPPRDNKAKAKNLTPDQLGLLRIWIDQGAKASEKSERAVQWQAFPENLGPIFAVAVTPDGQFAACSRAGHVFIYHVPSGKLVASESAHRDQVNALAFSPDGHRLASAAYREVKVWQLAAIEGKPSPQTSPTPPQQKVTRGDGRNIMIEGAVAKLIAADGKVIAELRGNRFAKERIDIRDQSLQVATGTVAFQKEAIAAAEKAVAAASERVKKSTDALAPKQQDLAAKQKALADVKAAKTAAEQALAAAEADLKKAETKLSDTSTKAAQLAAAATEAIKGTAPVDAAKLANDAAAAIQEAAKSRTERDQLTAARKLAADKIEPATKPIAPAEDAAKAAERAQSVAATEVELAKAEEQKATAQIAVLKKDLESAEAARKAAEQALADARNESTAAEQPIRAAAFSPDGTTIATAGDDRLIHTWSAETGAAFDVLTGHKEPVVSLVFSPSGELISSTQDGTSLSWSIAPVWKLERTLGTGDTGSPLTDRVNAVAFSRDGKLLATGSGEPSRGGEVKLWDTASGQPVGSFDRVHSDSVCSLDFSPDGKFLASGAADKMARVIELLTGKTVRSLEGHTHHVLGVSWSADGRTLATAGADGMVKVWDFATGDRKKNIEGYEKEVTAVRFVGATASVLTSSGDNRVRLVALDGKEVRAFPGVTDFMQSAAISADGKLVVAGGQDSILRVWNGADGKPAGVFAK